MPPIHIPFFFEAAILSRMRSPMTSRSNCAKDNRNVEGQAPHRGRRVELLRHRNKGRASRIEDLDDLGKIGQRAGQPVDLVDDDRIDATRRDVVKQPLQRRPIHRRPGEPAIVITLRQAYPAFLLLTVDESLAGLALRLQRVELLLEPLLGGFAGVDRAANPFLAAWTVLAGVSHGPAPVLTEAPPRFVRPKNLGPDQGAP